MLNQELLSQPTRLELLKAKRDQAALQVSRIGMRVKALSEMVNRKRQMEAEQAKIEAEETRDETTGLDPILVRFAERNAELTGELNEMVARFDQLEQGQTEAKNLAERIAADYSDAKATLETTGWTMGLGQVLIENRETLPDVQAYTRKARGREKEIVAAVVRQLQHREEARRITSLDQTVAALETQLATDKTPQVLRMLRDLVGQRQTLLRKALEGDELYLNRLRELDTAERGLLDVLRTYEDFLSEHLLWLRTADPTRLADLENLPHEALRLISPSRWSGLALVFVDQVAQSPAAWLMILLIAALFWKRRATDRCHQGNIATGRKAYLRPIRLHLARPGPDAPGRGAAASAPGLAGLAAPSFRSGHRPVQCGGELSHPRRNDPLSLEGIPIDMHSSGARRRTLRLAGIDGNPVASRD